MDYPSMIKVSAEENPQYDQNQLQQQNQSELKKQAPENVQQENLAQVNIEFTNEQLKEAGLDQNDISGLKQTIEIIMELSPGSQIDIKKLFFKYKIYNKKPEEVALYYAFG